MADFPPVPPAVLEFAEKHDIVDVKPNVFWCATFEINTYKGGVVYNGKSKNNKEDLRFILVNDKEIREATLEEGLEIMDVYL